MNKKLSKNCLFATSILIAFLTGVSNADDKPLFGTTETSISSDALELENIDGKNHFHFTGNVVINDSKMSAQCDKMIVISSENSKEITKSMSNIGEISVINVYGNVIIEQDGQKAMAEKGIIYPSRSYLELIGNVVIINENGTVTGPRFIWEKDKPAYIPKEAGQRPKVILNVKMPDLSEVDTKEETAAEKDKETGKKENKKSNRAKKKANR